MSSSKSRNKPKIRVEILSKADCCLCDTAKAVLLKARSKFDFAFREVDITRDPHLFDTYKEQIPVIFINGRKAFKYRIDPDELDRKLRRAGAAETQA